MIGRAVDVIKRYELGIIAMQTIVKEIPNCEMNIGYGAIQAVVSINVFMTDPLTGNYVGAGNYRLPIFAKAILPKIVFTPPKIAFSRAVMVSVRLIPE